MERHSEPLAPYVDNLEMQAEANVYFRRVLFTGAHEQLVLMHLKPNEDIGSEVHPHIDQFIRVEEGNANIILNGVTHELSRGGAVVIPAGYDHNVVNTSTIHPLKLYTLYSPPNHPAGTVHKTKSDAKEE